MALDYNRKPLAQGDWIKVVNQDGLNGAIGSVARINNHNLVLDLRHGGQVYLNSVRVWKLDRVAIAKLLVPVDEFD